MRQRKYRKPQSRTGYSVLSNGFERRQVDNDLRSDSVLAAVEKMEIARSRSDRAVKKLARTGPIVVTGAAGFIGFHVASRLLRLGVKVVGVDNFTPYYDLRLKEARLHASVARRSSRRYEWIWRMPRAFSCCFQTFAPHTLSISGRRASFTC